MIRLWFLIVLSVEHVIDIIFIWKRKWCPFIISILWFILIGPYILMKIIFILSIILVLIVMIWIGDKYTNNYYCDIAEITRLMPIFLNLKIITIWVIYDHFEYEYFVFEMIKFYTNLFVIEKAEWDHSGIRILYMTNFNDVIGTGYDWDYTHFKDGNLPFYDMRLNCDKTEFHQFYGSYKLLHIFWWKLYSYY